MDNKELTITGFFKGCDQEKLFDYLNNEEKVTLVASESCPAFLDDGVNRMAREKRVKPSVLWQELIQDGARSLLAKWKANSNTNVAEALHRIHNADNKMYSVLFNMVRAYDSHSEGVFTGTQAVVLIHDSLYLADWDDEDEAFIDTACGEWGLDFGDFCFLCAAVEGKRRGILVLYQEELDRTEEYLRRKVWYINALVNQSVNPLSKSVLETAEELLYNSKKGAD